MSASAPKFAALLVAGAVACAPALAQPTPADAARASLTRSGTSLADLQEGRALYVRRCSGCHVLHLPESKPVARWRQLLVEMGEKARLDATERDLVLTYLAAIRGRPAGAALP